MKDDVLSNNYILRRNKTMANLDNEKNKGTNVGEETPKEEPNQTTEVVAVKQNGGIGTALKIGGGLLFGAAFTGLGWLLRGIFGGRDEDDEADQTKSDEPTED